jgi:GTPase SAR1 family protein
VFYSFYRNSYLESLIRDKYPEGLPWTTRCFFCDETIIHSSSINHFKNDCQDLNWVEDRDIGTDDFLSRCIYDDGDITVKLNSLDTACIILESTVVMLKRKAGDKWLVAVVGTDTVQLKYSEEMTKTLIKYVLLDIQPKQSLKEFDVSSLLILEGVLRIVLIDREEGSESINTNQFFLNLVQDIKERDEAETDHESCDET